MKKSNQNTATITKKLFFILFFLTGIANAQIVNIPDANFKAKLLEADVTNNIAGNLKIDTNDNGEIEVSEAVLITMLNLSNSSISNLTGIQDFINLQSLFCQNNSLSSLDVSGMLSLVDLTCFNNVLSNLVISNNPALNSIDCHSNQLTTLDFANTNNVLTYIDCSLNSIVSFNVPNTITILEILANDNQIVDLDLSKIRLNTSLAVFTGNPIQTINAKNNFNENSNFISFFFGSNTLQFICADENEITSINNQLVALDWTNIVCNSYCSFTPGGNYNTIAGNVKYDLDNNGCGINDLIQPNIRVNINDGTTTGASFTDVNGSYKFYTQAGNFAITPAVENPTWFNFSPTTANVVFANNNNNTSVNDFCLSANGVHPDLEIVITPVIPARPGFEAVYKIVYRNKGNQTLSQQYGINFFYNQNLMQYVTSSVATSQSGVGSLSWDYTALHPFESRAILVTFLINPPTDNIPVNIGDELTFTSSIMPQSGDENTIDNLFILNQTVVGSYDPNDITCLEGDVVSPTEIGNYLHYNIRFENTGTAPAENIVAKVVVNSTDFDINSLQLLNTSHPVDARINGNIVEFIFQSINLESGGHGNVLLKVKSKSNLQHGDIVEKKANIYFDYNFPVETNNAETVFQLLNNPGFEQDNTIKIHPNPSQNTVYINGNFSIKTVELYDAQGRLLQSSMINENATTIDITNKSKGVYFVKVSTEKGIRVEKLVKN